jgi:hypothetical protein
MPLGIDLNALVGSRLGESLVRDMLMHEEQRDQDEEPEQRQLDLRRDDGDVRLAVGERATGYGFDASKES